MHELETLESVFRREFVRLVRALGAGFDTGDVADAVQEAFVAAERRWSRISRLEDPTGWIRRVAINRLLNERRNHHRRSAILQGVRPVVDADLTDELLDLRRSLLALPPRVRATAVLFYLADLPADEVAQMLEVSIGTVKSNLHDARSALRAAARKEANEP